ncbi:hypothetical protein [Luteibacter aegosomatissinici]|uniref:hypothetical protein n=1 Tax=Luteibacter aegosomatissinici TaxID=2911539 RepID=UPI001FF80BAE|nr:hypothetical protein [Luteibacter aegosomatissinici]UPG96418.1 hypothetical protein L2Y97_09995 [Luteibacter aegosomatissinici]
MPPEDHANLYDTDISSEPFLDDPVIDNFKPTIPAAYPDGVIPNSAIDLGLVVHAPIIVSNGHNTAPGNKFDLVVDGNIVPGTTVTCETTDEKYVALRMPVDFGKSLSERFHDIAYRDTPDPFGPPVRSGATQILIDRTPAGNRRLPRIEFPDIIQRHGLSLATLNSLPGALLRGVVSDYEGFDPDDKLHVFIRPNGADETAIKVVPPSPDGDLIEITFDQNEIGRAGVDGVVDFYYYVEDKANNRSKASPVTPVTILLIDAPERLPGPKVIAYDDDLITEEDIKPVLSAAIPALTPRAKEGDALILRAGRNFVGRLQLTKEQAASDPMGLVHIPYDLVWDLIAAGKGTAFSESLTYTHYRNGVPSRSDVTDCRFDLDAPGGRDPLPGSIENEALPLPILRGASGGEDNLISFADADKDALAIIPSTSLRGLRSFGLEKDDVVTMVINGDSVGEPREIDDPDASIQVTIPSSDLKEHAGSGHLSYTVVRHLALSPHISKSISPVQPIRIDSADGLPGGGTPLRGAVFPDALRLEDVQHVYGIHESDLVKGFTPVRIYGYANMKPGDKVTINYTGFNAFDGGDQVPDASGVLNHEISEADLDPKEDEWGVLRGRSVFFELKLSSEIVYALAFGRFELSYTATNNVGSVTTRSRNVLVSARRPKP